MITMFSDNYDIVLASNSPRRKEILSTLDVKFRTFTLPGIDESYPDSLKGADIPAFIARKKAEAYGSMLKDNVMVITADTIVWDGSHAIGKPKSLSDAVAMLRDLSGKSHFVYTAVTINTVGRSELFTAESKVTFSELTDDEIDYYVSNYRPLDKAGAYGIQEWIGCVGIRRIEGSFYNVMGLPAQRLWQVLKTFQ